MVRQPNDIAPHHVKIAIGAWARPNSQPQHVMSHSGGTILVVEDDEGMARLQQKRLERAGFSVVVAGTFERALEVVASVPIDLVLLDYQLPDGRTGLDVQANLVAAGYDLPVIVVTGFHDEATVIKALRAGVRDFVTKSASYIEYIVDVVERVLNQVRTERRLDESQALLAGVVASTIDAIICLDEEGNVALFNAAAERMFGLPADVAVGLHLSRLLPNGPAEHHRSPSAIRSEVVGRDAEGKPIPLEASISTGDVGNRHFQTWVLRDLTDQKAMEASLRDAEERLQQKQKLEAVGALAGGVAHEFNNLLQAILGYTKYAMGGLSPAERRHQDLEQVIKAADRAVVLTRQLLTFSRRNELQPTKVVVKHSIDEFVQMLRPLLGENIELSASAADAAAVLVDPGEFQQVLLNLCINARDAMPNGGRLTIASQTVQLEQVDCLHRPGLRRGQHAVITVADTGCGMSQQVKKRIFEPFFTTKGVGAGTGLGLAMVHGMVTQHRGAIHVYSEVGAGTTFRIYLPIADDAVLTNDVAIISEMAQGGSETILLAEDEPLVRDLAALILRDAGYEVLCATDGEDALRVYLENADSIALVLVDVIMPKMSGIQFYHRVTELGVNVPVVFSSGHAPQIRDLEVIYERRFPLVHKPYTAAHLLKIVRASLDAHKLACSEPADANPGNDAADEARRGRGALVHV